MANKQTYIAVVLAVVVVLLFFMIGLFGVGGFGGDDVAALSTDPNGPQAILNELQQTGTVSELRVSAIASGSGVEAKSGDTITVHYIGVLPNGTPFDSSRERGTPFSFTLGARQVIQGWDQALMGAQVGDRMIIAIPPELGYGAQAVGEVIPANSTLLFDVEVLGIESPQ